MGLPMGTSPSPYFTNFAPKAESSLPTIDFSSMLFHFSEVFRELFRFSMAAAGSLISVFPLQVSLVLL